MVFHLNKYCTMLTLSYYTQAHAWWESCRPKTLPLASMAIFLGSALAYWQGNFQFSVAFLAWTTASLLQILSNLANDYGDYLTGADAIDRQGPVRGIQKGTLSAPQLKLSLYVVSLLTMISGVYLLWIACSHWHSILGFMGLGFIAIVAAITYTVGNKPYGYMGLGDVSVFLFFGLLAVGGAFYLQMEHYSSVIILPMIASGLLATSVLNLNNMRDIVSDPTVGKMTLAVRLGLKNSRYYQIGLVSLALIALLSFQYWYLQKWWLMSTLLALPLFITHIRFVWHIKDDTNLVPALGQGIQLSVVSHILLIASLLLAT